MRTAFALSGVLAIGGLVLMGMRQPPPIPRDKTEKVPLLEVYVPLLGSTRQVRGMDLPEGLHAEAVGSATLLHPLRLTIRLPDGASVTLISRNLYFICRHGIVESVWARRPLESVRFREAVADLRRTMKDLGIEPDNVMAEQMAVWPEDTPGISGESLPLDFKTGTSAYHNVDLDVRVSPDPQGGWYCLMIFGADIEARAATQAAMRLATLPADGPLTREPRPSNRTEPEETSEEELPKVSIPLLGSTRDVKGMDLHPNLPKVWITSRDFLQPHRLTLRLSEDRTIALTARGMAFFCRHGTIEDVYVRRPMRPGPFREVVADLRRTLADLGLEPDERMREQMAAWPEDDPGEDAEPRDFKARMPASGKIDLEVRVCPDPGGGWYDLICFLANDEAKEASRAAAKKPSPPGPAEGSRP